METQDLIQISILLVVGLFLALAIRWFPAIDKPYYGFRRPRHEFDPESFEVTPSGQIQPKAKG